MRFSNSLELRKQGKTITLLTHATGTGKTHIAIADAKRLGLRTLYLAHRTNLLTQTQERFGELWPEVESSIYRKKSGKAKLPCHSLHGCRLFRVG